MLKIHGVPASTLPRLDALLNAMSVRGTIGQANNGTSTRPVAPTDSPAWRVLRAGAEQPKPRAWLAFLRQQLAGVRMIGFLLIGRDTKGSVKTILSGNDPPSLNHLRRSPFIDV
jgi:hypothetical protein